MFFSVPEEVSTQTKASFDQALKYATTASDATEKLVELNIATVKAAGADVVSQFKALTSAKDVQELVALQTAFAQANAEKALGYARAVYGWASESYGEVSKLVETQISDVNKTVGDAIDRAAKSAPTGSEFAFAAVKSVVTTANQAYDALSKATKQVANLTEASFNTATSAAADAGAAAANAPRKKAA